MGQQGALPDDPVAPALFRSINDRISEQLDENVGVPSGANDLHDFICECRSPDCTSTVRATVAEFDGIRAGENLLLVDPDHGAEAPDRLVRKTARFGIVEHKRPAA